MMSATMLVMLFLAKLEATILIMQLEMQVLPVREKMVCVIEPLSFWFGRSCIAVSITFKCPVGSTYSC